MAKAPDPRTTVAAEDGRVVTAEMRRAEARERARRFNRWRVAIHLGDETLTFCAGDVSARHVGLLRRRSGTDLLDPVRYALVYSALEEPSLDAVGWLIYLARLQAGEDPDYDATVDGLTAGAELWLDFVDGALPEREGVEVFADPPVSGEGSDG